MSNSQNFVNYTNMFYAISRNHKWKARLHITAIEWLASLGSECTVRDARPFVHPVLEQADSGAALQFSGIYMLIITCSFLKLEEIKHKKDTQKNRCIKKHKSIEVGHTFYLKDKY